MRTERARGLRALINPLAARPIHRGEQTLNQPRNAIAFGFSDKNNSQTTFSGLSVFNIILSLCIFFNFVKTSNLGITPIKLPKIS